MKTNETTPADVHEIRYTLDNEICVQLASGETLKFQPMDVLDMFHALLQAIGVRSDDNLYFAVADVLLAPAGQDEEEHKTEVAAIDEAAVALITEIAG